MLPNWLINSSVILDQMSYRGLVGEVDFKVSDISKWLGISKPTARKYLKVLVLSGDVLEVKDGEHLGKQKYMYRLSDNMLLHSMSNSATWVEVEKWANAYYANLSTRG